MAVLVVVPTKEPAAEGMRVLVAAEPVGELGPVLEGAELALAERVVVEQCGLECDLVTPRSASKNATGLATIGDPRSAWTVSWPRSMFCLVTVSVSSASASLAFSACASIQPGT
jgi:hypothetical protein